MLAGKENSLGKVATLTTHRDGRFKVEVISGIDEVFEFCRVFELRITVQEQGGMINRCSIMLMQLFQIFYEVVDALCIEKLS